MKERKWKKKRGKCVEKMEKLKRREDTVNRDEKNWWEIGIKQDKIEREKLGMR